MTVVAEQKISQISWADYFRFRHLDEPNFLLALANHYPDVVSISPWTYSPWAKIFVVTHPDLIEHIMKKNVDNYSKEFPMYRRMRRLLGEGLLTAMGPSWLYKRRELQTMFHAKKMQELAAHTVALTEEHIEKMQWYAKHHEIFNLTADMLTLVLRISLRFLFSEEVDAEQAAKIVKDFAIVQRNMCRALTLKPWVPSITNQRTRWLRNKIIKVAQRMVEKRRASPEDQWPDDLLTLLLRVRDPDTQVGLSEQELYDEIITFMVTGHETTGNALSWTWYSLAQAPRALANLQDEVKTVLGRRLPTYEDIANLPYTKQVLQESLRIYPTIWSFARRVEEEDNILGYTFPKHSTVVVSPYVMHRLAKHWPQAERFIPERFAKEEMSQFDRYSYMPFGVGPHTCIASIFAMIQAQLIIAMTAQHYQFELLPESYSMPLEPLIALRPKRGMRFYVKEV